MRILEHKILDRFNREWGDIEKVKNMSLNDYCGHSNNNNFTYWVEWRTKPLGGISGSFAVKTGIYERKYKEKHITGKQFDTDGQFVWYKSLGNGKDAAFQEVKKRILQIIYAVQNGKLEQIDSLKPLWSLYRWKVAFLYQDFSKPIKILPIFNKSLLANYLQVNPKSKTMLELYSAIIEKEKIKNFDEAFIFADKFFHKTNIFSYNSNPIPREGHRSEEIKTYDDVEYSDTHCRIQEGLKKLLENSGYSVFTESLHGNGNSKIDLVAQNSHETIYYEIKPYPVARLCIREALGQLLEYWYYNKDDNFPYANKLVIVGPDETTESDRLFLSKLRKVHKIPIEYLSYDKRGIGRVTSNNV